MAQASDAGACALSTANLEIRILRLQETTKLVSEMEKKDEVFTSLQSNRIFGPKVTVEDSLQMLATLSGVSRY